MAVMTRLVIELGFWKCLLGGVLWYARLLLCQPLGQPAWVGCSRRRDPVGRRTLPSIGGMSGTAVSWLEHPCSSWHRPPAARPLASSR
ncbi:MAG: hypothetical protein GTO53_04145 [Planctomycetales bacterium]|nr:hypothetical protein [Planctomycetales bacterium]NIM08350.1 hypothetical protein [Planctomycetales bacterium]NIN07826.1 hypothetical protein [Planctomycetales bacterium]NIN76951.1 hypothetical protein [Planctomycetales bacterium]NIO34140.1 hypothetical protein [Planctomycetales bacterium]